MTISRQNVAQASVLLAFFGTIRLALGLLAQVVIAKSFGAASTTDSYFLSFSIPQIFGDFLVGGVLFYVLMPTFMEYRIQKGETEAMEIASVFFTLSTLLLILASVIYFIWASPIMHTLAPHFKTEGHESAIQLARILSPLFVLLGLALLCSSLLQAYQHFLSSAAAATCFPLGVIGSCLLFAPRWGIASVAWGALAGATGQLAIQAVTLVRGGVFPHFSLRLNHPAVRRVSSLFCVLALSVLATNIPYIVQRMIASNAEGVISSLSFAQVVSRLPVLLLIAPLITAVFPKLSLHAAQDERQGFVNTCDQALRMIHFLLIPAVGLIIVFHQPIVEILFKRGAFTERAVQWTGQALAFLSLGILALAQQQFLSRAFFAMQRLGFLLASSLIWAVVAVPLNIVFYAHWHIAGLAAATSLLLFTQTIGLFWYFKRLLGEWAGMKMQKSLVVILVATVMMGLSGKWVFRLLGHTFVVQNTSTLAVSLAIATLLGLVVYVLTCSLARLDECKTFWEMTRGLIHTEGWRQGKGE